MKIYTKVLLTLIFSSLLLTPVNAEELKTEDVLGNTQEETNEEDNLEQIEEEREADFLNQLLLEIPEITDNPSHIITFIDPSEEEEGVQIEIDGESFQDITSPYSLPALSIGQHELRFKFVDKYGSTQILEKEIIVLPRPPIINSPEFQEEVLQISGTGLANSDLVLILTSGKNITTQEVEISNTGDWEVSITNGDLEEGLFTFTAYTRKYGYASDIAEPVTFEIGDSVILESNNNEIYFRFKDLSLDNVSSVIVENQDLLILTIGTFTLGFVISFLLFSLFKNNKDEKDIKALEKKINNKKEKTSKELTLKEKLSGKETVKKDPTKTKKSDKEKNSKEEKEEEKIINKVDFLKDFKKFDPDKENGKEKKVSK